MEHPDGPDVQPPVRQPVPSAVLDPALLARFQAGERAAFDRVTAPHRPRMLANARQCLGRDHAADAEDLVQQALQSAWRSAGSFGRTGETDVGAWLCAFVWKAGRSYFRALARRAQRTAAHEELAAAATEAPEREHEEATLRAWEALSATHREVLALRLDGKTLKEIGEQVGVSTTQAFNRVRTALAQLARAAARHDVDLARKILLSIAVKKNPRAAV